MKPKIKSTQSLFPMLSLIMLVLLLGSCNPQMSQEQVKPTIAEADSTEPIPLEDALTSVQPQEIFQNFYDITQVPRKSGSMEEIRKFLVDFGEELGLETTVDDAGNVIIRKPAAAGFEDIPGVILQAHMDMVAQQAPGKDFNFDTDPIQAFVSGDYIVTDGTTLGADDGIGIAMIMTVMQSPTLKIGPVEGLFTVDEETTMSGANGLDPDVLKGRILINLDTETEGTFYIGSAGGEHVNFNSDYSQGSAPSGMASYLVKIQGLQGGHSGVDIDKGRGHATKLLVRLFKEAAGVYGVRLANLNGGSAVNAIPRDASAVVVLADTQVEPFTNFVKEYEATIKSELAATEPELSLSIEPVQSPTQVMDSTFQSALIDAIHGTPQGIIRMSDTVPGLVETSINLGIVQVQDGKFTIIYFPRSSIDSELRDASEMIMSTWELAGYQGEITDSFAAWTPDPDSYILKLMNTSYHDLYGRDPDMVAIHAGLECGAIGGIYPDMDMISIGPTMENVHTPSERLFIPAVGKVMDLLTSVLKRLAEG